ncbi:MAG TPA: hypothetical protein VFF31_33520, partial [Blastocatellia bacterium]|nr:hypothetical protein [Blastocatellia bacterium]
RASLAMKSVTDGSMFRHSSWSELAGSGLSPFTSLRMPDDHQVTTGILLAGALGDGRLGPAQGRSAPQFSSRCMIPPARQPV